MEGEGERKEKVDLHLIKCNCAGGGSGGGGGWPSPLTHPEHPGNTCIASTGTKVSKVSPRWTPAPPATQALSPDTQALQGPDSCPSLALLMVSSREKRPVNGRPQGPGHQSQP